MAEVGLITTFFKNALILTSHLFFNGFKMWAGKIETLNDLIDRKHRILTIIGVFGALTLFSTQLEKPNLITFGSLAIFLILCYEFHKSIPIIDDDKSFFSTLRAFEIIFFFGILIPIYLYVAYYSIVLSTESKILFGIFFILAPVLNIVKVALDKLKDNPEFQSFYEYRGSRYNLYCIFVILLIYFSFIAIGSSISYLFYKALEFELSQGYLI